MLNQARLSPPESLNHCQGSKESKDQLGCSVWFGDRNAGIAKGNEDCLVSDLDAGSRRDGLEFWAGPERKLWGSGCRLALGRAGSGKLCYRWLRAGPETLSRLVMMEESCWNGVA